jgi:hypothetical protein
MRYAGLLLMSLSALVAIHGETWNPNRSGLRRVTTTGWVALALAVIGFGLSVAMVREDLSVSQSNKAALVEATDHVALVAIETDSMKVEFDSYKAKIAAYEAKISAYQSVIQQIRDYSERQEQTEMSRALNLSIGKTWKAPNKLYPGSKIEVYFFEGSSLELSYGGRKQDLLRGTDNWARVSVVDDSGEEREWALSNQSSSFKGKVTVYSTPRSRSKEWRWLEEIIKSVPSK